MRIFIIGTHNRNINILGDVAASIGAEKQDINIYIVSDSLKDQILDRYKTPEDFRSFALPNQKKIFIFDNALETYESLSWLMIKEICHMNIRKNMFLNRLCHKATNKTNQSVSYYGSLPENNLCSNLATAVIGKDFSQVMEF